MTLVASFAQIVTIGVRGGFMELSDTWKHHNQVSDDARRFKSADRVVKGEDEDGERDERHERNVQASAGIDDSLAGEKEGWTSAVLVELDKARGSSRIDRSSSDEDS